MMCQHTSDVVRFCVWIQQSSFSQACVRNNQACESRACGWVRVTDFQCKACSRVDCTHACIRRAGARRACCCCLRAAVVRAAAKRTLWGLT